MRSCIFQLRRHQTHSTFPLSQAEFAPYFYPLAFVLVILNLDIYVPSRCKVFACYLLFPLHLL